MHHRVWYRMITEVQKGKAQVVLPDTKAFLTVSARAHLYHAITFVNRVFDRTDGSVSVTYFLNYVESNAGKIEADTKELTKAIARDKMKLASKSEVIDRVHTWRDKHFSHIDKINIGQIDKLNQISIEFQQIKQLLKLASDILNGYQNITIGEISPIEFTANALDGKIVRFFDFIRSHPSSP